MSAHEKRFAADTIMTAPRAAEGTYTNKSDKNAVTTRTIVAAKDNSRAKAFCLAYQTSRKSAWQHLQNSSPMIWTFQLRQGMTERMNCQCC